MKTKKILCPVDFSSRSDAALDYASSLASESEALLFILHVDEGSVTYVPGYDDVGYFPEAPVNWEQEQRDRLSRVTPTVEDVEFETRYLSGKPENEVLDFADREDVDLIVMGTHGRTGVARLLMGSVAEAVVRRAKLPLSSPRPARRSAQVALFALSAK